MEYSARALGAPAQGPEVGRRAHRQGGVPDRLRAGLAGVRTSTCGGRCSRTSRVREALGLAYDFETINVYKHVQARQQPVQQLRLRRRGPAVAGRAGAAGAVPQRAAAGGVRPARGVPPRTDTRPERAARQPASRRARCSRRPAGSSAPTACCATPRASPSSSSTSSPATAPSRAEAVCERNLAKLGIKLKVAPRRLRALPQAAREVRLRHDHDRRAATSRCPTPADYKALLRQQVGRRAGQQTTSAASRAAAVDHLLERDGAGEDDGRAARRARARSTAWSCGATGRCPTCTAPANRVSYWDKFGIPQGAAEVLHRSTTPDATSRPWPVTTWWIKDAGKARTPQATRRPDHADLHPQAPAADDARRCSAC